MTALNARGRGKRRFTEQPALQAAVEAILTRYRAQGLLAVRYTERVRECPRRRYGSRPATVRVARDPEALANTLVQRDGRALEALYHGAIWALAAAGDGIPVGRLARGMGSRWRCASWWRAMSDTSARRR